MSPRSNVPKSTIVDIAAASGVSVSTVSRILNNKPDVAEETRQRVLGVMDELGFAPQSAWQQIRSGRTRLIAMHVPPEFNPPAYRLIMAAALGVEDAGYSINIITRPLTDSELLGIFRGRQADGIILLEILADDRRPQILRDHGFPFVMIGHRADNTGLSFVDVDIEGGVDLAVEHLAGLGHREVGFLTVDPVVKDKTYGFSTWALRAYEAACRRLGLASRPSVGGPTDAAMTAAALRVIDENPGITAFIAPQQQSVIGVLKAARARSLRLPDDLSLVGMLSESMSGLTMPPLTTVDFPADELGHIAARMILDQLDGGQTSAQQILLQPELIIRESTSAPPSGPTATPKAVAVPTADLAPAT